VSQTSGIVPALYDGTKKTSVVPMGARVTPKKKAKKRAAK